MDTHEEQAAFERARHRVHELRAFYLHAMVFVAVNGLLHVINFVTSPRSYWAFWPVLGWGIGLVVHAAVTFRWLPFSSKEWEERKIRELMEKERRSR